MTTKKEEKMKFEVFEYVDFKIDDVYKTYRDKLPELVKYIPNVKKIVVEKKEKKGNKTYFVNRWYGKYSIPKIVQPYLKAEEITWVDRAVWDDSNYTVEWEFEPLFFKEYVKAFGVNRFLEEGGRTKIILSGEFNLDLSNYPKIPKLLRRIVVPQIEKFTFALIKPNLIKVCRGVEKLLKEKKEG